MVTTLLFDKQRRAKEIKKDFKLKRGFLYWTHLEKDDNIINELTKRLGKTAEFREDLIEEQRPNILQFEEMHIIVLSFPDKRLLENKDEFMTQISIVLSKDGIITISNQKVDSIETIQDNLLKNKEKISGKTTIITRILDVLIEEKIRLLEEVEDIIETQEKEIVKGNSNKKMLRDIHLMKEKLHYSSKMIKANLEVIREILSGKTEYINLDYFSEHTEDRMLYLFDLHDYLREDLANALNVLFSIQSQKLNQQIYWLTIVGSLLIIPTIISGLFGMNVALPELTFWQILTITVVFSLLIACGIKFYGRKI